jgi:hypothetical protein
LAQQTLLVALTLGGLGLAGLGIDVIRHYLQPGSVPPRCPRLAKRDFRAFAAVAERLE